MNERRTIAKSSVQIEHRHARVGPADISYQVAGAGQPLVLVHGLCGSSRWWARNITALAGQFRVYVVDLIGFGASCRRPFVLGEAAGYLMRWMDQIGVERASVVGHSMGGFIAADLAADFPDRVERLVLVDAAALPFAQGYLRHTLDLVRQIQHLPLSFLPVLLGDTLRAGPATIWSAAHQLLSGDIRPKLARIQAPTLVVWGEHDTIVPLELGRQLCRHLRTEKLVVIESAGHNPMWDCPEAFNRVVLDFLNCQ